MLKGCEMGACSLSLLSEKTRESNHLQMSRCHLQMTKAALSRQLFKDHGCWSSQGV